MSLGINPFSIDLAPANSLASGERISALGSVALTCPHCLQEIPPDSEWQSCPYCQKQMEVRIWPAVRRNANAATALSDQATCFFHPEKAFQACCRRCGRFVCALCDLQLGAEHVCPTCFERGRADSAADAGTGKGEWRHRDVLYDSIASTAGWAWIIIWPLFVIALPSVIFLHVKYRKAPRSYLFPRSGWRFWTAYVGLIWLPLLLVGVGVHVLRELGRR
jgi:hypothetical protein